MFLGATFWAEGLRSQDEACGSLWRAGHLQGRPSLVISRVIRTLNWVIGRVIRTLDWARRILTQVISPLPIVKGAPPCGQQTPTADE